MKTPSKIDFFLPHSSQYGVLHHFTKKMFEAFQKRGFVCRLFKADDHLATLNEPPDFTLGYNGAPQHASGILLCDLIERPHICCLVDLAYRYQYLTESSYIHMGCNDLFSERMFREQGFSQAFFLPVAGDTDQIIPVEQYRSMDLVLMATFIDYEGRRSTWSEHFDQPMVNVLNQAVELIFAGESLALIEAFQLSYNDALKRGEELYIHPQIIQSALESLELYVRGRDRADLVRAITQLPIHIYEGSIDSLGWKEYLNKQSNIIYHPPVSFEESLKVFSKAKIVLNSSPHTRHGASERVFNALARGAVPLTNYNDYMSSVFAAEKEILFFENKHLDLLEPLLEKYLDDNVLRNAIAKAGQKKVLQHHGWDNRVDLLINYLDKI